MKEIPKEIQTPVPPKPKRKETVLDKLKARRKTPLPGAERPNVPVPVKPPTPLSPAELTAGVAPPPPPPQADPQAEEGSALEVLYARALRDHATVKPADDKGMSMLQAVALQVRSGQPLKSIDGVLVPNLSDLQAKIQLLQNASIWHEAFERMPMLSLARWVLEKTLWDDLINGKLTPSEKLTMLVHAIKELEKNNNKLDEFQGNAEHGGKGASADVGATTTKADKTLVKVADPTLKDLEGTSPVGRELARRLISKAGLAAEKLVQDALKPAPAK
jgi:hypothetical protein